MTQQRLILSLKRDYMTGLATAARALVSHKPRLVVGDGQGALIALGLSSPLVLEACLATRNVGLNESIPIARAWGAVKAVVLTQPRIGRGKLELPLLRLAVPELFDSHPWENLYRVAVQNRHTSTYEQEKVLLGELQLSLIHI